MNKSSWFRFIDRVDLILLVTVPSKHPLILLQIFQARSSPSEPGLFVQQEAHDSSPIGGRRWAHSADPYSGRHGPA